MKKIVPSVIFRLRAMQAMKPMLSILVLVTLIATAPSLIGQVMTLLTDANPANAIEELYTEERIEAMTGGGLDAQLTAAQEISDGLMKFYQEKGPFMALTAGVSLIFSPVLTLGFYHTLLKTLRREEIGVSDVLARLPLFFKAIGLNLMVGLRIFVWMLPGFLLMLCGSAALLMGSGLGTLLMIAGVVVTAVFTIRANFSYYLSAFIMADAPETGIRAAIARSREVMNGRRMELFLLDLSFIGWQLLLSIAQALLLGMLGNVIGMTLGMFASLFLQLYMYMAQAAFYQEYAVGPLPGAQQDPFAAPENGDLN